MPCVDVRQFALSESGKSATHMRESNAGITDGHLGPTLGRHFAFTDFTAAMEHAWFRDAA